MVGLTRLFIAIFLIIKTPILLILTITQIMLTRGVGGSLMCGGSIVGSNKVITAGHCCDG